MRDGVVAILLVVVVALGAGAGYFVGVANKQTTTMTTTAITTTTTTLLTSVQRFETPIPMSFSLNGQFDTLGMYCLSSPPGTVSMNLTAAYPWPLLTEPPPSITITYEFKPFPLNSTIPAWLSLSTIPEAVVMRQGQTATVSLVIAVNETTSNLGQEVFFHLWADYKDPASGSSVTNVIDFDFIVADTPSGSSPYQC
jgi:hypothetical protein